MSASEEQSRCVISGLSALTVGFLFGGNPVLLVIALLVWGFAVVADSAQFSAAVNELSPQAVKLAGGRR